MTVAILSACTVIALVLGITASPAAAIDPPELLIGPAPTDTAGPEFPMRQDKSCLAVGVLPDSDLTRVPPPELTLDLSAARALSTGAGTTVAILDTGVSAHPRLPTLGGAGDFILSDGDGLFDCDAHGTLIAGIIGASASTGDSFHGIAPDARLLSIRLRSGAFTAERPVSADQADRIAVEIRTLARAITRAANQGAGIIVIPLPICVPAQLPIDQAMLSAAVGYATRDRGALIIAGAGAANGECAQNPAPEPGRPNDPRNWAGVETISVPGWFAPAVLSVAATTAAGTALTDTLSGPWVSVAAPGAGIESLGPDDGGLINGVGAPGKLSAVGGASFAAAYVAGVAALLRSRYPAESAEQIARRLQGTAHAPARGADNTVGVGVIDPLAALSVRTPPVDPSPSFQSAMLLVSAPDTVPDTRPLRMAALVIGLILLAAACSAAAGALRRR